MNQSVKTIFITSFILLSLAQCRKEKSSSSFNAYFYTNSGTPEKPLTLFIDGQNKGALPSFAIRVTCDNDTLKQRALAMNLNSGKYKLEAKNSEGTVVSTFTLKIKCNSISSCSGIGGNEVNNKGENVTIGLFP